MSIDDDESPAEDTQPPSSHFGMWLVATILAFVITIGLIALKIMADFADACC